MTDADETYRFPADLHDLTTPRRQLRVVYEVPPHITKRNIYEEADETRWWLLDRGYWQNDSRILNAEVLDEDADVRKIAAYPILDHPDEPVEQQDVSYYLGCDAEIYVYVESAAGFVTFDPDDPFVGHDVEYIIEKLQLIRGE